VDLVVDSFTIPASLADRFLLHHIHPHAPEGKTLLQLVDRERALRVDLFRAFGTTLTRAHVLDERTGLLPQCPDLLVCETYSAVITACDQCRDFGPFRRAAPDLIVSILGYW
jgi:hypothetical protein